MSMKNSISQNASEAVNFIRAQLLSPLHNPSVGIICGSGLGGLANTVLPHPRHEVKYTDVPHFPQTTVAGHAGKLLFGCLQDGQSPVVMMIGRSHYYEGHSMQDITFPIRLMKLLGVHTVIVTNAAGGLSPEYAVGDIVVLNDHIMIAGLAGTHPLRGPNVDDFGVRFPPLSDAYDLGLRRQAHKSWKELSQKGRRRLHEGIYAFVGGPSYETRAECRMLRMLGADLVGMSTVPEIVVARHCNMKVLALSLVTNKVVSEAGPRGDIVDVDRPDQIDLTKAMEEGKASHEEVLAAGREAAAVVERLVRSVVQSAMSSA